MLALTESPPSCRSSFSSSSGLAPFSIISGPGAKRMCQSCMPGPSSAAPSCRAVALLVRWLARLRDSRQLPHLGQNLRADGRVGRRSVRALFEHGANLIERRKRQIDQLRS